MKPEPLHFRHWPAGVSREPPLLRTTLPACLAASARQVPNKAAIVYGGPRTSNAQLQTRVEALAGYLQQRLGVPTQGVDCRIVGTA